MDRSDGSELQRYQGHRNTSYRIHSAFGHGEATVIAGDEDGKFWRWDLADNKRVIDEVKIAEKSIMWVEQAPTDEMDMFVTASSDGSVKIWR
jgi:mitogen-activated protein kinase organizer 1